MFIPVWALVLIGVIAILLVIQNWVAHDRMKAAMRGIRDRAVAAFGEVHERIDGVESDVDHIRRQSD